MTEQTQHRTDPAPGWHWGPFTARVPFLHTRLLWPEFLQGLFVAAATGLALVPIFVGMFGLSFEQAVAMSLIHTTLIASASIVFGEPYAPGWITPALPLALGFVAVTWADPTQRFQAMTAITLDFVALLVFFGVTGLGGRLMRWLPTVFKAGLILGAGIAALKRVFVDDAEKFLLQAPVATTLACAICLILMFSAPLIRMREKHKFIAILAALGLLPGFLAAAIVGPLVGEVNYEIQWGWLIPPLGELWDKVSPFAIGWPQADMFIKGAPVALIGYVLLFGDLVTGNAVLADAQEKRPDQPIEINTNRSHLSIAIRNAVMAITAPFFPTQGTLWTGVHVVIAERWKQGKGAVENLHSGIQSYYLMGLPVLFLALPLLTGLKPLMGIALSLTLVLTGFACSYVAMAMPRDNTERGTVLLIAMGLAVFSPWVGLAIAVGATLLLTGWNTDPEEA